MLDAGLGGDSGRLAASLLCHTRPGKEASLGQGEWQPFWAGLDVQLAPCSLRGDSPRGGWGLAPAVITALWGPAGSRLTSLSVLALSMDPGNPVWSGSTFHLPCLTLR